MEAIAILQTATLTCKNINLLNLVHKFSFKFGYLLSFD